MGSDVLNQRRQLARNGVVIVVMPLDSSAGKPAKRPEVVSMGFAELDESDNLFKRTSEMAYTTLEHHLGCTQDLDRIKREVSKAVSKVLYEGTGMRPKIIVHIEEL